MGRIPLPPPPGLYASDPPYPPDPPKNIFEQWEEYKRLPPIEPPDYVGEDSEE